MLTIQARSSKLKPPSGQEATGANAVMLYTGLYLTALGIGGIKGSLPSHGAEQLDQTTPRGSANRSTFFNYFVFSLSCGALVAVTLVVWLEDNRGWQWGFAVSTLSILLSIPAFLSGSSLYRTKIPSGSPLTVIAKALAAKLLHEMPQPPQEFLKVFVKILPIFASTIMLSCCLAQLSTFSVQQAAMMDTLLGNFAVAPASLPVFPVVFVMILTPIYDRIVIPFARKLTGIESGITQLQRIGIGLALSVLAMAVAALVEAKRKHASNSTPISFLWVAPQYLFLGSAVLFTLAGLLEFFFAEAPEGIRSLATSLPWASLAMGYYLSSVLVSVVRSATGHGGRGCQPWLAGSNLNSYQLDRFYWLLCGLSLVNFGLYLFWAVRYKYRVKAGR